MGGQALVVCSICDTVVNQANATKQEIETSEGYVKVWVCKTCMRLGSEDQVRKYIMKEEKKAGR